MAEGLTSGSIQEMAAEFANGFLASLNAMVSETVGVDVIWFRATPDKRSQDVIFQSYTLYGVEDCPLTFKAVYTDNNYDDAAITFNIMGLEYAVPLTLEIAVNTWYEATNYDGTLPQRGDIVFIPISRKLMEVVSMTPVKKIGAQLTSFCPFTSLRGAVSLERTSKNPSRKTRSTSNPDSAKISTKRLKTWSMTISFRYSAPLRWIAPRKTQ